LSRFLQKNINFLKNLILPIPILAKKGTFSTFSTGEQLEIISLILVGTKYELN